MSSQVMPSAWRRCISPTMPAASASAFLEADDLDAIAVRLAGEQRLAEARAVLRDDGIGGVEDVPGRAEILFQADLRGARKVAA